MHMNTEAAFQELMQLPPSVQQEVFDFIAFLRQRYQESEAAVDSHASDIVSHPFIGLWKDRDDMIDAAAWVRATRVTEWS